MGAGRAVGAPDDTVGGGTNVSAGLGPAFAPDLSAGYYGDTQDAAKAGCASGSGGGGEGGAGWGVFVEKAFFAAVGLGERGCEWREF